jgi:hypothetical protein
MNVTITNIEIMMDGIHHATIIVDLSIYLGY